MATKRISPGWRVFTAMLVVLLMSVPAASALAQDAGAVISVDRPTDGDSFRVGDTVTFYGWAAHQAGPGTGVDRVSVLDAPVGAGGKVVVETQYGLERTDVGARYGAAWTNSGYQATWRVTGGPGNRTFWVYAHSPSNDGWTNKTVTIRVEGGPSAGGMYGPQYGQGQYGYGQGQYGAGSAYGAAPYGGNPFIGGYGGGYGGSPYGGGYPYGVSPLGGGPYGGYPYGGYPYGGYPYPPYPLPIGGSTVTATASPTGTVVLTWASDPLALQYRIYEQVVGSIGGFTLIATAPQATGTVTATLSGLAAGSTHTYQVRSVNAAGIETVVLASSTTGTAVLPPTNVIVTFTGADRVGLSFTLSTSPNINVYNVKQSTSPTGPFALSNAVAVGGLGGPPTAFLVLGLAPRTTYYFVVTAIDLSGVESLPSAVVSATTGP